MIFDFRWVLDHTIREGAFELRNGRSVVHFAGGDVRPGPAPRQGSPGRYALGHTVHRTDSLTCGTAPT